MSRFSGKNILIRVAVFMAFALPVLSHAIGLGDMEVLSALGHPLLASVPVLMGDQVKGNCQLRAWTKPLNEGVPTLRNIDFTWTTASSGPRIMVRTEADVNEPAVNVGVEMDCEDGSRIVRAYTLLLDPDFKSVRVATKTKKSQPEAAVENKRKSDTGEVVEIFDNQIQHSMAAYEAISPIVHEAVPEAKPVSVQVGDLLLDGANHVVEYDTSVWSMAHHQFKTYSYCYAMVRALRKANPAVLAWKINKRGKIQSGTSLVMPTMESIKMERAYFFKHKKTAKHHEIKVAGKKSATYSVAKNSDIVDLSVKIAESDALVLKMEYKLHALEKQISDLKLALNRSK